MNNRNNEELIKIYQEDTIKRKREHLERIKKEIIPCSHDKCTDCHGTGIKSDGTKCIHFISCMCPKCCPRY